MHENHRSRVRRQFLANGISSSADHEILEHLLFYSIPRRDTNETAHRLVGKFGSLAEAIDADYSELLKTPGVGDLSATLIKLIQAIIQRYTFEKQTDTRRKLNSLSRLGEYLVNDYMTDTVEVTRAVLLTADLRLITCETLFTGSVNSSSVSMNAIVTSALSHKASMVVLAHNHPGGAAIPSKPDIDVTVAIEKLLSQIDIHLLEHFVIAGNSWTPIMAKLPDTREKVRGDNVLSQFYSGLEAE